MPFAKWYFPPRKNEFPTGTSNDPSTFNGFIDSHHQELLMVYILSLCTCIILEFFWFRNAHSVTNQSSPIPGKADQLRESFMNFRLIVSEFLVHKYTYLYLLMRHVCLIILSELLFGNKVLSSNFYVWHFPRGNLHRFSFLAVIECICVAW